MTLSTLRPTSTVSNTGTLTGGATAHAVLSDNSDASYVSLTGGQALSVGMGDLTLPAGAVVKETFIQGRISRTLNFPTTAMTAAGGALVMGGEHVISQTEVTVWQFGSTVAGWGDAEIDAAVLSASVAGSGHTAALYEAYFSVRYVTIPVVAVTAPTGTSTTTNQPVAAWTDTLDADGGDQTAYEVKVFSAAQYGAGGFDPATSTPTAASGIVESAARTHQVDALANATYRVYARVAQTVNGTRHWSAWAFSAHTVNVPLPTAPTLVLTAQSAEGRIKIDLDDTGAVTTDRFEIQRSVDGGATWQQVRVHDTYDTPGLPGIVTPLVVGTALSLYDYEAPNGVVTSYRARALHNYSGVYAASVWTSTVTATWLATDSWLKSPVAPALNLRLAKRISLYGDRQRPARHGVFQAVGALLPVVVSDSRGGATGTIVLQLDDATWLADLDALLDSGTVLLLQVPASYGIPDRYVRFGDHATERTHSKVAVKQMTRDTLTWIEVAATTESQTGAQYA